MSAPSDRAKAGAALAAIAIVGALVAHSVTPTTGPHGHHVRVAWQSSPPAGVECMRVTARASAAALATFSLSADAGDQYVVVRICATDSDAGQPSLPSGMEVLPGSEVAETWDGGQPELEAWAPGTSEPDPSMCACSSGSACLHVTDDGGTEPAPMLTTMQPGAFTGAGCVPRSCVTLSGQDIWPAACAPDGGP